MRYTIVHRLDERTRQISNQVDEALQKANKVRDDDNPEIIIVIGGDGTFLVAVHKYIDIISDVLVVGMHTGTLGFFADFKFDEINQLIDAILHKTPDVSTKRLLKTEVFNEDDSTNTYYALNEIRIENIIKTQILKVWIDQVYLETFRGTGICVSTQPGSTGYNRSLKGAVISDRLQLLQMTEITGIHHRLFQSLQVPLILEEDERIDFASPSFKQAILCYDHLSVDIRNAKHITCTLSKDKKINFARYRKERTYTHRIKALF